jgi:hypothetical protein
VELVLAARDAGFPVLHKPLRPAAMRALLCAFKRQMNSVSRSSEMEPSL